MAEIRNATGDLIGHATFVQQSDGVEVTVTVAGLSPGEHGTHIHAQGMCDHPGFTTAGGHFNPEGKQHGLDNPQGPHAEDLPNLEVSPDGSGVLSYMNPRVTLSPGAANSLLKVNGTSIMIHANPDDQKTDPSGGSGTRIACGMIAGVEPELGSMPAWLLGIFAVTALVTGFAMFAIGRK